MSKELAKAYEPREVEDRIYDFWLQGGYFHAEVDPEKKPYTIVIPPPNITGQLHMGHALDETIQDILIRFKRMQGYSALWLPGTDHASIATEAKIVEAMKKEGLTKEDVGREGFLERAWDWKAKFGGRIVEQLKKLGSSCDWERERFTLDEGCSEAVKEVFVRLYEKGLIYRGERIINWCPHCKTSISDAEVEFDEHDGNFWHLRYPLTDGTGELRLATTRPETLLGDTAVAVHPDDERYKAYVGKTVTLPLVGREIPVVADEYVEMDFGTGVVKITPAHDPNDFEVGLRHNLPVINVMDEGAVINENGGKYQGMTREEARKAIVKDLDEGGYLVKVEPIKHNVGSCYRCGTVVEPRVSKQWFVKMEPLAKPAIDVVREEKIRLIPERMEKIYYNWMENIKDWCISRQLWWGHRIPAWYCEDCGETIVAKETPEKCPKCGGSHLHQDEDTLDTWFSSALWPFSTLGWPEKTPELSYFYPTDTLVTGNSPGNDMRFTEEKLESSRNFANKIWNAARFIHMNIDGFDVKNELPESLTLEDQWIVSALNTVTKEVTENLEKYELGIAVQKLYDFIWDQFCDWYIELAKTRLMAKDETSVGARQVLVWTFTSILKLMHPFMPYITEEIWQTMPHEGEALMAADYPIYNEKYAYPQAEAEMHRIMETIRAIRNRRAEMNVPPSRRAKVYVASSFEETFRKGAQFVARLAYASEVEVGEAFSIPGAVTIVTADAKVYIPMDELVDKEAELKRLNKELETAQKQLDQVNAKLNNPGFTGKAPANVVEGARQNAQKLEDKIKMIASSIEALNG